MSVSVTEVERGRDLVFMTLIEPFERCFSFPITVPKGFPRMVI